MTDTFSFHPPPVSPSYSYPVLSEPSVFSHQRPNSTSGYGGPQHEQEVSSGPYSYGSAGPVDGRREEGLGEAIGGGGRRRPEEEGSFVPGQRSRGGSPGAPSSLPYAGHFQAGPFSYSNRGMLGANIRNTRPMTAPSSVSAPYFQGAIYSPHPARLLLLLPSPTRPGFQLPGRFERRARSGRVPGSRLQLTRARGSRPGRRRRGRSTR